MPVGCPPAPVFRCRNHTSGRRSNIGPVVMMPLPTAGSTVTLGRNRIHVLANPPGRLRSQWLAGRTTSEHFAVLQQSVRRNVPVPLSTRLGRPGGRFGSGRAGRRCGPRAIAEAADAFGVPVLPWDGVITDMPMTVDPVPRGTGFQPVSEVPTSEILAPQYASSRFTTRLAVILARGRSLRLCVWYLQSPEWAGGEGSPKAETVIPR